jgi:hypothetical protein
VTRLPSRLAQAHLTSYGFIRDNLATGRGQMIARIWRGWAPRATADDYQRHYETDVSRHLCDIDGFRGARLLRQDYGQEVMFTSITFFTNMDAVQGFAGEEYELAVVEETARRALSRWDERVSHHDVAVDLM